MLVGERLDFRLMPELETISEATAAASAILAEARLSEKNGLVSLPPNCGVELFDVIRIYGSLAGDAGVDYRVIGIRFDFNAFTGGFIQKLYLCAV